MNRSFSSGFNAKYSDIHSKRDRKSGSISDDKKLLLTEKESYTAFLEGQLEKISSTVLSVDKIAERIDETNQRMDEFEEKLINSSKLMKLFQSFTEAQEQDNRRFQDTLNNMNTKTDKLEFELTNKIEQINQKFLNYIENSKIVDLMQSIVREQCEDNIKEFEDRILDQVNQKFSVHSDNLAIFKDKIDKECELLSKDIAKDIHNIELRVNDLTRKLKDKAYEDDISPRKLTATPNNINNVDLSDKRFELFRDEIYSKIDGILEEMSNTVTLAEFENFKDRLNDIDKLKDKLTTEMIARKEGIKQLEKIFQQSLSNITQDYQDLSKKLNHAEHALQEQERNSYDKIELLSNNLKIFKDYIEQNIEKQFQTINKHIINIKDFFKKNEMDKGVENYPTKDIISDIQNKLSNQFASEIEGFTIEFLKKFNESQKHTDDQFKLMNQRINNLESKSQSAISSTQAKPISSRVEEISPTLGTVVAPDTKNPTSETKDLFTKAKELLQSGLSSSGEFPIKAKGYNNDPLLSSDIASPNKCAGFESSQSNLFASVGQGMNELEELLMKNKKNFDYKKVSEESRAQDIESNYTSSIIHNNNIYQSSISESSQSNSHMQSLTNNNHKLESQNKSSVLNHKNQNKISSHSINPIIKNESSYDNEDRPFKSKMKDNQHHETPSFHNLTKQSKRSPTSSMKNTESKNFTNSLSSSSLAQSDLLENSKEIISRNLKYNYNFSNNEDHQIKKKSNNKINFGKYQKLEQLYHQISKNDGML